MQVWNVLHAARWKIQDAKSRQKSPSGHHRTTLSGYIFATKARIDNRKKNLMSSNMSSICPHNMAIFGPLAAEINPVVWGTRTKCQRVLRLGSVTARHGGRQPNFAALNRGRHLCSAGRPSRWALPHSSLTWFHCRQCIWWIWLIGPKLNINVTFRPTFLWHGRRSQQLLSYC